MPYPVSAVRNKNFGTPSPLLVGLVSYWNLASVADSAGSNTLTNNNGVTFAAGKLGNCASFASASSQSLSAADNASLDVSGTDFTFTGWFNVTGDGIRPTFIAKGAQGSSATEYALYRYTDNKIYFDISIGGVGKEVGTSSTVTSGAWHFFAAWFDTAAQQIKLQIDDGVAASANTGAGVISNTVTGFKIGTDSSGSGRFMNGSLDEFGFWKRVLTSTERTQLYNSGSGLSYPF